MMISKESLKSNFATMDQVLSHQFFKENTQSYNKFYAEMGDNLKKFSTHDLPLKDAISNAVQKTEQNIRAEHKLVKKIHPHITVIRFMTPN